MNTFTVHLCLNLHRFRWFHVPMFILVALLQRVPLVRAVLTADIVFASSAGMILKSTFAGAVAVGMVDTLAGATQLTANPASPATATVGQSFQAAIAVTGAPLVAGSYEVAGSIPPGLRVPGIAGDLVNASTLTLTGTPTEAGSYTMRITAWELQNKSGMGGTPTFDYTVVVTGGTQEAPMFTTHPM